LGIARGGCTRKQYGDEVRAMGMTDVGNGVHSKNKVEEERKIEGGIQDKGENSGERGDG